MTSKKQIGFFEKHLTLWVLLCITAGITIEKIANSYINILSDFNLFNINIPVAVLVWLMIYPMMVQIDFTSIENAGKKPKGLILTLIINWLIKPFTMAFFAWIFFDHIYSAIISPDRPVGYEKDPLFWPCNLSMKFGQKFL